MRQHEWKQKQAQAPQELAPVLIETLSPGPAQWIVGPGAWAAAAAELAVLPQPIGLVGETGLLRIFRKALTEAWLENGVELVLINMPDGIECSRKSAEAVAKEAKAKFCATILGIGGGKIIDIAKWAAYLNAMPLVTAPTSAATCAGASGVVVCHSPEGSFEDVLDLPMPAQLCVVDTTILAQAPANLLAAGMADTLAKWLEWKALPELGSNFGNAAGWILAERGALACETLGAEALREPKSHAWNTCIEACLLWSAQASCLGQAPAAAAHSLANALTKQALGRNLVHGAQVGLGLLWQEALLEPSAASVWGLARVRTLLKAWQLPVLLPAGLDLEALLSDAMAPEESVHGLGIKLNASHGRHALNYLIA